MTGAAALRKSFQTRTTATRRNHREGRQVNVTIDVVYRLNSVVKEIEQERETDSSDQRQRQSDHYVSEPSRSDCPARHAAIVFNSDFAALITLSDLNLALLLQQSGQILFVGFELLGIGSHLDLIARLLIGDAALPKALHDLISRTDVSEAVVLSTCNRTEIYVMAEKFHGAYADVRDFLAEMAHLAPESLRPKAVPQRYVDMQILPAEAVDARAALTALPPLIKGYLRLGGFVGDGAVVDHQFHTTDVCVVVKTDLVTDKYYRHYTREDGASRFEEA